MRKVGKAVGLLLLAAALARAQQGNEAGARHANANAAPATAYGRGNWVGKRMMSQEFMDKLGIKGEQAARLKSQVDKIDQEALAVEEQITQTAMDQAELAKKVLTEPGADTTELMKLVERIGRLRTEQAKLATRRLIVMRDNLTPEQRQKASQYLAAEQKKWREERENREKAGANRKPARPARPEAPKGW